MKREEIRGRCSEDLWVVLPHSNSSLLSESIKAMEEIRERREEVRTTKIFELFLLTLILLFYLNRLMLWYRDWETAVIS